MDDARAALARVAADMGAGKAQLFAQKLDEQRTALDFDRMALAVHRKGHVGHLMYPRLNFAECGPAVWSWSSGLRADTAKPGETGRWPAPYEWVGSSGTTSRWQAEVWPGTPVVRSSGSSTRQRSNTYGQRV
jgi:hypothetical protein